ncbi:MAG TPA: ABC transporter permease [Vicinamibacterales bacterium]|nr:ABC transporter permease [Vicinamibacterales bacterium]
MHPLEHLAQDLRVAIRSLSRRPVFFAVAATTLAIGIGANTATFSVVRGVLLRPLPYPAADELVLVNVAPGDGGRPGSMSYPDLADLRSPRRPFVSLIGVNGANLTLTGLGDPAIVEVSRVTGGVLATFGVSPVRGRDIRQEEFGPGGPLVAVITYAFWQERLGGAEDALGRTVTLNGNAYEIVGIGPQGFAYPGTVSLWIPRALNVADCGRGCHTMQAVGRLAGGVSLASARAEVDSAAANLERAFPDTNTGKRFLVRGLKQGLVGDVETGIWITFASAVLVLLITCANVASLMLARAAAREGEVAVRAALGASRARLAAQVLVESGVLAVVGGAGGVALAFVGVNAFQRHAGASIPRSDSIAIDGTVLAASAVSIAVVILVFGALPALATFRTSIATALSRVGRGSAAVMTTRFRRALLAGEIALSVALLVGAGLLWRTFVELHAVDVGVDTREVSRFSVVLPESAYPELDRAVRFYESLESQLAALPGVEAVGAMFGPPLGPGHATGNVLVEGRPAPPPGNEPEASVRSVTPGLLSALRIPLRSGRLLQASDSRSNAEPVAVINEQFAREHFSGENPIGRRVRVSVDLGHGSPAWRIVGVVGDVRFTSLTESAGADIYLPHGQYGPLSLTVHVRTAPGAPALIPSARQIVQQLDAAVPIYRVGTLEQAVDAATAPTRLYLMLVALFALTAALLAAVGLYGVMSYVVAQRTREIGVRMALGARRQSIVGLVVRQGMQAAAVGLTLGVAMAIAASRYLESVLFGVRPDDPLVFGVATALMALVALLATVVPALRASGIDPADVLRAE